MREMVVLAALCLLMVVAGLATVVWVIVSAFSAGLPAEVLSFDSLLLILICLLLAAIFAFCFAWVVNDLGFWSKLKRKSVANPTGPTKSDSKR